MGEKLSGRTERARYVKEKGFVCSRDNHVLFCPDLSKANKSQPFYLHCSKHRLMFELDLSSSEVSEFIEDFPHGCREG